MLRVVRGPGEPIQLLMSAALQPRVSVVTVSYHSEPEIAELVACIRCGEQSSSDIEVVVVSNSSDCGPLAGPGIQVVDSGGNVGFSRANRVGALRAHGEFLLFCNPDVRITGAMIRAMAEILEKNPAYGTVSPFLSEGELMCRPDGTLHEKPELNIGACFMIRQEVYGAIGGWDGSFFLWWEDTDLRDRVVERGLKIGFVHNMIAAHSGGHSTSPPGTRVRRLLTRVWVSSHVNYLLKRRGTPAAVVWCLGSIVSNSVQVVTGRKAERAYADPRAAAGFALRVLFNAWRMRRYVAFDGRGFLWEPALAQGLARPRAVEAVGPATSGESRAGAAA
jgi:N-acetylglucosaminyl-diphospho-decaprenol L-rhamnosyltransferase